MVTLEDPSPILYPLSHMPLAPSPPPPAMLPDTPLPPVCFTHPLSYARFLPFPKQVLPSSYAALSLFTLLLRPLPLLCASLF